jgi:hypothetical protein
MQKVASVVSGSLSSLSALQDADSQAIDAEKRKVCQLRAKQCWKSERLRVE